MNIHMHTPTYIDLCNHAAGSKHVLTGRAAPGVFALRWPATMDTHQPKSNCDISFRDSIHVSPLVIFVLTSPLRDIYILYILYFYILYNICIYYIYIYYIYIQAGSSR